MIALATTVSSAGGYVPHAINKPERDKRLGINKTFLRNKLRPDIGKVLSTYAVRDRAEEKNNPHATPMVIPKKVAQPAVLSTRVGAVSGQVVAIKTATIEARTPSTTREAPPTKVTTMR
jgi:hypothetical protein